MRKHIVHPSGIHEERPSFYEKYFKLNQDEKRELMKFGAKSLSAIAAIVVALDIDFREHIVTMVILGLVFWVASLLIYLIFYKKPRQSFLYG